MELGKEASSPYQDLFKILCMCGQESATFSTNKRNIGLQRNAEREPCSQSDPIAGCYKRTAMILNDSSGNREPQAAASGTRSQTRGVDTVKAFKDSFVQMGRKPFAFIAYFSTGELIPSISIHRYHPANRGVAQGVLKKIRQHLLQPQLIANNRQCLAIRAEYKFHASSLIPRSGSCDRGR